jgi:hypothetical protein
MLLRIWRLMTTMLVALSMGTVLAHLLELPGKMTYDGALWARLLQTLYPQTFGTVGAFFEMGALVMVVVLAFLVVRHRGSFGWTLAAALFMIAANAIFWIWVAPVNEVMGAVTPQTIPANWTELRDQWEYAHAARAFLQILALFAIVCSTLVEIPLRPPEPERGRLGQPAISASGAGASRSRRQPL